MRSRNRDGESGEVSSALFHYSPAESLHAEGAAIQGRIAGKYGQSAQCMGSGPGQAPWTIGGLLLVDCVVFTWINHNLRIVYVQSSPFHNLVIQ